LLCQSVRDDLNNPVQSSWWPTFVFSLPKSWRQTEPNNVFLLGPQIFTSVHGGMAFPIWHSFLGFSYAS
jgi:hypothetical protein